MFFRSTLIIFFFFTAAILCAQSALIDSLEKTLPSLSGKEKLRVLGDLSWELNAIDIARSEQYAQQMLQYAQQQKDSVEIGNAFNYLSIALYRKGDYDGALSATRKALSMRKKLGDQRGIASSYNKFVNIYTDQVKLDSALFYAIASLKIFEEINDSAAIAQTGIAISSIHLKDRNWKEAEQYAIDAYRIAERIGFLYAMGGAAGNIAVVREESSDFEAAISWYEKAKSAFEKVQSLVDLGNVALNLGVLYRKMDNKEKALQSYQMALSIAMKTGEKQGQAHASANIGGLLNDLNNPKEAIRYFLSAQQLAETQQLQRVRLLALNGLTEAYARTGNGEEAAKTLAAYVSLRDSIYNEERTAALSEMRTKFEVEKKEQENAFLKKENELKEREKRNIFIGAALLLVMVVMAGVFYFSAKKRKQETAFQVALVKEREKGLEAVFEATEEERKRIAKDLHDGVGQQLSGLRMSWEGLSSKITNVEDRQRFEVLTSVLDDACKDVRSISHQMMPKTLMENGLLPAIEDMLRKSLGITPIAYKLEHFQVENERFPEKLELGLYRIAQELVNNIIKHSGASEVVVQLYRNKKQLILIVEDNGRGFDTQTKREGIGLMNISSRITTVGGDVIWEPGPQSGSVATVRVPLME